jgi:hypothetical protein
MPLTGHAPPTEPGSSFMLRIQRWARDDLVGFTLSGRIEASHVADLEALLTGEGDAVVLDLADVTLVAPEVVRFLAHCEGSGVTLQQCPTYIRVWITQQG